MQRQTSEAAVRRNAVGRWRNALGNGLEAMGVLALCYQLLVPLVLNDALHPLVRSTAWARSGIVGLLFPAVGSGLAFAGYALKFRSAPTGAFVSLILGLTAGLYLLNFGILRNSGLLILYLAAMIAVSVYAARNGQREW